MQILKGKVQKSVTVEKIMSNSNSFCVVYYETPLYFNNYFLDSDAISIIDLRSWLETIISILNSKSRLDYFIIYTNKTEKELVKIIEWLEVNEKNINSECILLTCKP